MYAYNLCIYISSFFVSTLYPVLSPPISTLYLILLPSISVMNWISSLFELILTTFTTCYLVKGVPIYRISTSFHPMITSQHFANKAPCIYFVRKYASMCYVMQCKIDVFFFQPSP